MVYSLPDLIAGILITAYWARALRLAYKMRRQTGNAANFTPPETLGRRLRIIWRPLVVFWIAHFFVNALANENKLPYLLRPLAHIQIISWIAVLIIAAGVAATLLCWKRMGKSWRMGINPDEKTQLIVSGPYAFIRHPIYAIQSLMLLASMALLPSFLMLACCLLMLTFLQWEARREEKYLVIHHGAGYVDYCRHTGGFLPRSLRAYRPT
ncbi:MAG TPA: isoprenylcysteine carboxylmethyltransferase family protein [Tepidisphaeraceae bacterium]|jgi:protein-S-isoprenylcysteine O-methyltransferase Ste14|nr:isoprenylcysteine carboxylmethyltransferase family protein [Tepidisphaeraceae bacterium]HEV8606558.1 isoprenylcysteine carboxylmethyltransferase family protein [Tepidisphaeraceae bacterium]